ncbi:T9SS C-terminal target domain-containing protein [candidate division KSB1 bacterium]|nr:T9SS type A sorting domain-containing protein [candidate division KSB1 bacterium]RQW01353.1 MAG: T9SS C-terminal target domain-containing protein [candidate division KSB1 bacterium]
MKFRTMTIVGMACLLAVPLFAQNMIMGSNMEDESAWEIVYYNAEEQPVYEFNYTGATVDVSPLRGGALRITMDDGSTGGQLLLYQRVTCTAGNEYKASALIKMLDYDAPEGQLGQWFQFYVAVEEPDPTAGDFNPAGTKMFNIDSWITEPNLLTDWEDINGYFESLYYESHYETAPYWICPGDAGTKVDVTVGVKFGSSAVADAYFDLICDDVCFYEVESANMVEGSDMENEDAWDVIYYNADSQPFYEFVDAPENSPHYLRGKVLHVMLEESAGGQLLLYQRLPLTAGETYRASGAIQIIDYYSDFEPVSQGPWYQFYVTDTEPDPAASDFNPDGTKMFDISAWDAGCDMLDFEQFQGYWEQVRCLSEQEASPYFTVPGDAGTTTDITVGIKFGLWGPSEGRFELYVDDIQFLWADEWSGSAVEFKADPVLPQDFALEQNHPNPFNPTTTISFTIPETATTNLRVYNTLGKEVAELVNGHMQAGRHTVNLDVTELPSGIYYYTLQQNNFSATKKCVVLK